MPELSDDEAKRLLHALAVSELTEMRGWTVLIRHLEGVQAKLTERLVRSKFKGLDEATDLQGEIRGLDEVRRFADEQRRTARDLQAKMGD